MKRFGVVVLLVGAVFGAASFAGEGAPAANEPVAPAYGFAVDIAPDTEQEGAYEARAIVTDLTTEEVLSAPRVRFLPGPDGRAQTRSGVQGGLSVYMEIEVDERGETATYKAEIRSGEDLVSLHKVRIRLVPREAAE